jgi:hypothetical protein
MTDTTPDLTAAILRAEASSALAQVGCTSVELFLPHIEGALCIDPAGNVAVKDEDGSVRYRVSPVMYAREVRAEWEKGKNCGRYFK